MLEEVAFGGSASLMELWGRGAASQVFPAPQFWGGLRGGRSWAGWLAGWLARGSDLTRYF